jgi:hypothetical protein
MRIKHNIGKSIILFDCDEQIGELNYKIIDDEIVLMGTFINLNFRGNGYFNVLLGELVNIHKDRVIYVCCIRSFIFPSIERFGFRKINDPIPHWGKMSNGTNFKYIP